MSLRSDYGFQDDAFASEVILWVDNTRMLYARKMAMYKNLEKKIAKRVYQGDLAVKMFRHLADAGEKDYRSEFQMAEVNRMSVHDRNAMATFFRDEFEEEYTIRTRAG